MSVLLCQVGLLACEREAPDPDVLVAWRPEIIGQASIEFTGTTEWSGDGYEIGWFEYRNLGSLPQLLQVTEEEGSKASYWDLGEGARNILMIENGGRAELWPPYYQRFQGEAWSDLEIGSGCLALCSGVFPGESILIRAEIETLRKSGEGPFRLVFGELATPGFTLPPKTSQASGGSSGE